MDRGEPIRSFICQVRVYFVSIAALEDRPIKRLEDFKGRGIGVNTSGGAVRFDRLPPPLGGGRRDFAGNVAPDALSIRHGAFQRGFVCLLLRQCRFRCSQL